MSLKHLDLKPESFPPLPGAIAALQPGHPAGGFLLMAGPHQLRLWGGTKTPAESVALQECLSHVPVVGGCEEEGGHMYFEVGM